MAEHLASWVGPAFWLRALLALAYIGVPVLLAGASIWWATRRSGPADSPGPARRARTGRLAGLGAGVVAGLAAIWGGQGQIAPAAAAAGYLLGLLTGELLRAPRPGGLIRVASLQPRSPRRYLPPWSVPALICVGIPAIAAPAVLAALPAVRYGPSHGGPDAPFALPGGVLHWPVAATVAPAAVATLALVLGGLAVRRAAWLPPAATDRPSLDEHVRRNAARAAVAATLAVQLFALAAQAVTASSGLAVPAPAGGLYLGSRLLIWAAVALAGAAVAVWCMLGRWKRLPAAG